MKGRQKTPVAAEAALRRIFAEVGLGSADIARPDADKVAADLIVTVEADRRKYRFAIQVKERVTPQIADALFDRMNVADDKLIPALYCPVISPRVAEMAKARGISYIDSATNCFLRSARHGLLISRTGIPNEIEAPKSVVDPFSPKSSRIVRAMLHAPRRGWKVTELADHPDVRVSSGLASKVKHALLEQGYVRERNRLLYLKDPLGLLNDWAKHYPGPTVQCALFVRGDVHQAEAEIARWCREMNIEYALARYSAAWIHAPEVRYSIASVYVSDQGLQSDAQARLSKYGGAKQVDSGANLMLMSPYDEGVFSKLVDAPFPTTSALQTFLDLKQMSGRGEEAAQAIFESALEQDLRDAAPASEEP